MEKNQNMKGNSVGNNNINSEILISENTCEDMTLKIQTLDNIFPIVVKKSATVNDLKEKICETMNIPTAKQRLIFQGKWLQNNNEKLKQYKISDENVIHLVAKTFEETNPQPTNSNVNNNSNNSSQINYEDTINGFIEIPIIRSNRRGRRRRIPHFDISESFESLHQNITTLQLLQNCKNKFDEQQVITSKTITPFDFNKSKYEVGQWVDVKDTIDQWLEAQIIQVRNNLVYVHYNGWGTRWDEWIEMNSPRIAAFKYFPNKNRTYTLQSNTSVFLCPYPSFVPDANIEPQHRSIDTFYYMEKSLTYISEVTKMIETMSKLRKKGNTNNNVEEKSKIKRVFLKMKKDDFEETKQDYNNFNRNYSQQNHANNNNAFTSLSHNDYELLFMCSQLVPLMDRTGRLLSDISLHLSHLILNSNLYPQLLLGYNQNNEISDTLSCTSNYSIYTNEGSSVSGFIPGQQFQHNEMFNNLQNTNRNNYPNSFLNSSNIYSNNANGPNLSNFNNILQNIQNSNQMINNYSSMIQTNFNNSNNTNNNLSLNNANNLLQNNLIISNNLQNTNNNNLQSSIPINNMLNQDNPTLRSLSNQVNDNFPKINLQIPAMLSPGEVTIVNGYNPYGEQNIDIYVHTLVTPSTVNRQQDNTQNISNYNNTQEYRTINNQQISNQQRNNVNTTTDISIQTGINENIRSNTSTMNTNTLFGNNQISMVNRGTQINNNNISSSNNLYQNNQSSSNNLENIITMISNNQLHNRRSSMGSENSRDSQSTYPQNINHQINIINNRNVTNNNININTGQNNVNSSQNVNIQQSTNLKETSCQTDININSNNNKINYNEALIDSISNKFERNNDKRYCGKSQKSVKSIKSVSDLSDFDHYNEDEHNDYSAKTKNNIKFNNNIMNNIINQNDSRNLSINTLTKLNESFHSASVKSLMSKNENEFEEKDEEKN